MSDDLGPISSNENYAPHLVRLRQIGLTEAELIKLKLEAEGIPTFISGQNASVAHPLAFSSVELLVADTDLERANEILARPAQTGMEGEYVDENWRCPLCHRKPVELLPLSAGQLGLRVGCLTLLFLPLLVVLVEIVVRDQRLTLWVNRTGDKVSLPWGLVLATLTVIILLGNRKKRCKACGFEWKSGDEESAAAQSKKKA